MFTSHSERCGDEMETKSEVLVEVREESKGIEGDGPEVRVEILVVSEREAAVLTEKSTVTVTKDDQMEIEKCALMLHTIPAPSDHEAKLMAPATKENTTPSLAPDTTECKEDAPPEPVVAKEQEVCNGDGAALPEFLPVPEADREAAWGNVPDAIAVQEPMLPPKRPRVAPECVEVDDVVQTMRNILFNLAYADDAHLNPEDEAKVRDLLAYHPNAAEKTGSGIDFIKIKRHSTFKDVRCFWVVRTDGTETDFSYHKCLKEKVAKENPSFVDRYDAIYRQPKRPRMA